MWDMVCPLCGLNSYSIVNRYRQLGQPKYGCRLVCCANCDHYFTVCDNDVSIVDLYQEGQYELVDTRRTMFGRLISFDNNAVLNRLERLGVRQEASILDIGCGKGVFLHIAAERGLQTTGIETAKKRAEFARTHYALNVFNDEYTGGAILGAPFDVITVFHVLEHLPRPFDFLKSAVNDNLSNNGWVVVEVPRFDSLQSRIAMANWIHLDPPLHISHFSSNRLHQMLNNMGLEIIVSDHFSIHNGLLGMIQSVMSAFGYKKMLIAELKLRKTMRLIVAVFMVLPFALILELIDVVCGRGGIIRHYCRRVNEATTHDQLQVQKNYCHS